MAEISKIKVETNETMRGRPLFGEEVDRFKMAIELVTGLDARDSWTFLTDGVVASGLQLDELTNISWDIPQTIQPQWQRGRLPVLWFPSYCQKNGETQAIPLCPWFELLLRQIPSEERTGWIFNPQSLQGKYGQSYRGKRASTDWVGKILSRIGHRANFIVDEWNPRTGAVEKYAIAQHLRRTFAQNFAAVLESWDGEVGAVEKGREGPWAWARLQASVPLKGREPQRLSARIWTADQTRYWYAVVEAPWSDSLTVTRAEPLLERLQGTFSAKDESAPCMASNRAACSWSRTTRTFRNSLSTSSRCGGTT